MAVLISNGTSVPHATSSTDMLDKLSAFITGVVTYASPTLVGGVRLVYMRGRASAVAETWTVTCTNAGTNTWSVVGSVTGATANATVGTPYDNGRIAFELTDVSGANALNDQYTVQVQAANALATAGQSWDLIRIYTATGIKRHFFRGHGTAGTDQIFVNLFISDNAGSDIYNIGIVGATGHLLGDNTTTLQPGTSSPVYMLLLSGSSIPYWFIANGRRFMAVAKVTTVYECMYAGFILPTGTPSEYPYPLAVGGCEDSSIRYSDTGYDHSAFFCPDDTLKLREKNGSWLSFDIIDGNGNKINPGASVSPFGAGGYSGTAPIILRGVDGTYVTFPTTLTRSTPTKDVFGDLDGVYAISGEANASENIAQISGVDYLVVQNTFRTAIDHFAAFKLE
jgi:hypothetical protein